eukprot:764060-Hanusia_phi.AAC.1
MDHARGAHSSVPTEGEETADTRQHDAGNSGRAAVTIQGDRYNTTLWKVANGADSPSITI